MAHKRKDTLVAAPKWWRHLRPYNKRRVARKERRATDRTIQGIHENEAHATEN
jgi:hypothetical protein